MFVFVAFGSTATRPDIWERTLRMWNISTYDSAGHVEITRDKQLDTICSGDIKIAGSFSSKINEGQIMV